MFERFFLMLDLEQVENLFHAHQTLHALHTHTLSFTERGVKVFLLSSHFMYIQVSVYFWKSGEREEKRKKKREKKKKRETVS